MAIGHCNLLVVTGKRRFYLAASRCQIRALLSLRPQRLRGEIPIFDKKLSHFYIV